MDDLPLNVLSDLIANLIIWVFGGLIFGLVISIRRILLNRFFGIKHGKPLLIYLSTHPIKNDVFKHRSQIEDKPETELISSTELKLVPSITNLFSSRPFEKIADAFAGAIDFLWWIGRPELQFDPSPLRFFSNKEILSVFR